MQHSEIAVQLFKEGRNCSQAVLLAFSDVTKMDESLALRRSSPFGGGMGRQREVCGAVSGMLMVLGIAYGYEDNGEKDANKKAVYQDVQDLCSRFREASGSIICREILKNPASDPNPTPRTAEFYKLRPCERMVATAAALLEDYIAGHPLKELP